jgi:hypothetical protein
VYWVDGANYTVNAVPKTGGASKILASNQYEIAAHDAQIAVDDTYVYWVAHGDFRTRKDGTGAIELIYSTPTSGGLALLGPDIYYLLNPHEIVSFPKAGGSSSPVRITRLDPLDPYGRMASLLSNGQSLIFSESRDQLPSGIQYVDPPSSPVPLRIVLCLGPDCTRAVAADANVIYAAQAPLTGGIQGFPASSDPVVSEEESKRIAGYDGVYSAFTPGPCGVIVSNDMGFLAMTQRAPVTVLGPAFGGTPPFGTAPQMVFDGGYLYWVNGGSIGRVPLR